MTQPQTVVTHGEITSLTRLVRDARGLDIPVPKSVSDELALSSRLTKDPLGTQRELQNAHAALGSAPIGEVDAGLSALAEASLRTLAAQALGEHFRQIAISRLRNAVYSQLDTWEAQAVEKANRIIEDHKLSEVSAELPDLTRVVSPIDLSHAQSRAVQRFRDATDLLHPLWNFYSRIATIDGHDVGYGGADGLSSNLSLACRLGDPGSFSRALSAAGIFASIGVGSDAARKYGPLAPFCVPALAGYELHLSTSDDAARIRRAIQPAAA